MNNCFNIEEIPLDAYKNAVSVPDETTEFVIESLRFVDGWFFEPLENEVLMKLYVCLGVKDHIMPIYPQTVDGQDIITPEFHLKMKDNSFYIVPKD